MGKLAAFFAALLLITTVLAQEKKACATRQLCIRQPGQEDFPCPDPKQHENPEIYPHDAEVLTNPASVAMLSQVCPYLDATQPLCCNDDQVAILNANFQQIDSVFGQDVPMCGVNQKKQWCEYTCSPHQSDFLQGVGYKQVGDYNFTSFNIWVDEDFACTQFKSCSKVSLIASASIQSSMSFLDFLGVNGENQSLSIMAFQFDPLTPNATEPAKRDYSSCSDVNTTQRRLEEKSEIRADGEPQPLDAVVYPCNYPVPDNGTIDGYTKLENATCNYCQEMCDPPDVTSEIDFFDGFNVKLAWIVIGSVAGFSILWQIFVCARAQHVDQEIESCGLKAKLDAQQRGMNVDQFNYQEPGTLPMFNSDGIGNSADITPSLDSQDRRKE